eukprot:NODE_95_length_21460_cov_0.300220.p6 type:complete len:368 gc:universal NODE_95_length_21460_cov_0.300220:17173-16070(-)
MRLCTFNVNGLERITKNDDVLRKFIEKSHVDIICLQETKLSNSNREIFNFSESNVYLSSSQTSSGYCGVSFIFKQASAMSMTNILPGFEKKEEARYLECEFPNFVLINIYVPSAEFDSDRFIVKENFLYFLSQRVSKLQYQGKNVIIVGDFNISHREIDCYYSGSEKNFNEQPLRLFFTEFLIKHDLLDVYRHFHPDNVKYTCWNTYLDTRPSNCGARIDYILINTALLPLCQDCNIMDETLGSDHCPVILDIFDSKLDSNWRNGIVEQQFLNYSYKSKNLKDFFGIKQKNRKKSDSEFSENVKKVKQSTLLKHFNIDRKPVLCNHNEVSALKRVVKKGINKGRYFYCCNKPFNERCEFFQWQKHQN